MPKTGAYEIPGFAFTLETSVEIDNYRLIAVDENGLAKLAGTTDVVVGGSRDHRLANQLIPVATGIVLAEAGEAITCGAKVMATAGKAMKHTEKNEVAGIALTAAGGAGEYIALLIK